MKTLKDFTLFMAFLMLMTSCYSYKYVYSSDRKSLEVGDKLNIVTNDREYKHVIIESINDSIMIVEKKKHHYQIETDPSINILYKRQIEVAKTIGSFFGIVLIAAIIAAFAGSGFDASFLQGALISM